MRSCDHGSRTRPALARSVRRADLLRAVRFAVVVTARSAQNRAQKQSRARAQLTCTYMARFCERSVCARQVQAHGRPSQLARHVASGKSSSSSCPYIDKAYTQPHERKSMHVHVFCSVDVAAPIASVKQCQIARARTQHAGLLTLPEAHLVDFESFLALVVFDSQHHCHVVVAFGLV